MAASTQGQNQDLLAGDWSQISAVSYYSPDYTSAGYNAYLTKSIDLTTQGSTDSSDLTLSSPLQYSDNSINYDQSTVSGSLGDIIQVGNITIDGSIGRITIYDSTDTEVVRIGYLEDV